MSELNGTVILRDALPQQLRGQVNAPCRSLNGQHHAKSHGLLHISCSYLVVPLALIPFHMPIHNSRAVWSIMDFIRAKGALVQQQVRGTGPSQGHRQTKRSCLCPTQAKNHCSSITDIITLTSHECHGILYHLQFNCLFNSLIRLTMKETSKLSITGPL